MPPPKKKEKEVSEPAAKLPPSDNLCIQFAHLTRQYKKEDPEDTWTGPTDFH